MSGVTLQDMVGQLVAQMGKTLEDVKDVIPNGPQPTHLYVLFKDSTWAEVELKYPVQA